jgi:hypothetical protein
LLDDVIASYLATLSEVEFFDAFAAVLNANGFYDVERTHGPGELGRDFIAKRSENGFVWQYAIQTKAGNMRVHDWREARNQIEDIRLGPHSMPGFDADLPRRAILALTGRLVGATAPSSAHGYKSEYDTETFIFDVWPLERLITMMVDAPEIGLAGTPDAAVLGAVAAIHVRAFREEHLDELSLGWISPGGSDLWRAALVALVVSARLARSNRKDLAALVGPHLIRATWASVHAMEPVPPIALSVAEVGRGILLQYVDELRTELQLLGGGSVEFVGATQDVAAMITYPVRCMRFVELFGLAGLSEGILDRRREVAEACIAFIRSQPGASHPPSDNWAVSIVPAALLIAEFDPELVGRWLEEICVWTADFYGPNQSGLAGPWSTPREEIDHLVGAALESSALRRRTGSFLASVVLDLAASLELQPTYDAIRNEFLAVNADVQVVECNDDAALYRDTRDGVFLELRSEYDEYFATSPGWECAPHHRRPPNLYLERVGRGWDLLAICSVMRDRCFPSTLRGLSIQS